MFLWCQLSCCLQKSLISLKERKGNIRKNVPISAHVHAAVNSRDPGERGCGVSINFREHPFMFQEELS